MRVQSFGLTDVGNKRTRNEDSFLISNKLRLYIVADGMGGHSGGQYASSLAVNTIEEVLSAMNSDPEATVISGVNSPDADAGDRLKYAIEVASQKIYDQSLYEPELKGMGTTIAAVMAEGNWGYVANVGDSRVYLLHHEEFRQISTDHSLVSEQVRAGLLSKKDAQKHKFKNIITRSVGYQEEVETELVRIELSNRDRFLLCSDGLTNMVSDEEIKNTILSKDIETACQSLIDQANAHGGDDNITVILGEFNYA